VTTHQVLFAPVTKTLVMGDYDKIGQVIQNYISNATKYSARNSTIEVQCDQIDGNIRVSVRDQGIGIRKEDLPRLFERFYRVREIETRNISGFGIGLYLCAEVIKRHNGKIWAESKLGEGSTFYFSLPSC
jgi:signal transduction histidine kinase